jgi:Ca-activated chloride channel family protein
MRFEWPLALALAPLAMVAAALGAWWSQRRRVRLAATWSPGLAALVRRGAAVSPPLLGAAVFCAALGVAGPRGGRLWEEQDSSALNVLIAVDISRSMLAEDAAPNRLERASREARRLVQDLPGDRVGVIAFAAESYLLVPLTLDRGAVDLYLETLHPDVATAQGTHLEPVLRQGFQVLDAAVEGGDRALVVFTDGEAHDSLDATLEAARQLRQAGIHLVLVSQGGGQPVPIPVVDQSGTRRYHRDASGEVVLTMRRDAVLREVARAAGGAVIPAALPDQATAIREELRALARRPARERRLSDLVPLAWVGALAATVLLGLQSMTRRGAALAGLALVAVLPPPGSRAQRAAETATAYAAALAQARRSTNDTAWYNAGTAALAAGRLNDARAAFERAMTSLDPGLRYRVLYNLGLAALLEARGDTTARAARLAEAARRFQQALLLDPTAANAKWNLELALALQPPAGGSPPSPPPQPSPPQPRPLSETLSRAEAEALLQSVAREEVAARAAVVHRQRITTGRQRVDW